MNQADINFIMSGYVPLAVPDTLPQEVRAFPWLYASVYQPICTVYM
jgi:hypothetical protein